MTERGCRLVDGGIYESKKLDIDLQGLERLGINEIALRKGHKDYIVVLVDLDRRCLIGNGSGQVFYFSPRSLQWMPMEGSCSQFLLWACSDFGNFYDDMMWPG